MASQDKFEWRSICSKLPKRIFNIYFEDWQLKKEVSNIISPGYSNRHVSKYTTIWTNNGYLVSESKLYDKASKRLNFHVGTIKPYLEYLKEISLYHKRISILLQALTNSVEIRKIIIKNDRDIIQGINEILLLYYHSKQIINIIRNILKIDEKLLLNVLTDSKNELAKAFIQLELQEENFWKSEKEKKSWWNKFVNIHSIEPSYITEFNDLIIKQLKKED